MAGTSDSGLQFETEEAAPPPVVRQAVAASMQVVAASTPAVPPPVRRKSVVPPPVRKPVNAQPPPPPAPEAANDAANETSPAAEGGNRSSLRLRFMPGWLVSLMVHLILLILLALLTVTTQPKLLQTILNAGFVEEEVAFEQVTELTLEPLEDVQAMSADPGAGEALVAEAIDVSNEVATGVAVTEGDLQVDAVNDIGGLFDGNGTAMTGTGVGPAKGAEFFGVKAAGHKFVFVVDSSNSMRNGKFDAAKEELEYAIRRLSPEQLFYVVFFDKDAEKMILPPDTEPPTNVVPATVTNINRFVKWMGTVKNELRTDPYEAVKFALSLKPDAIYILSDGKFTDRGMTVRFLENENVIDDPVDGPRPRAIVNTIAFWQRDGEEAMQSIAKKHKGTYRFVPQPRGK